MKTIAYAIAILLCTLVLLYAAAIYSILPDELAFEFDFESDPNNWMGKTELYSRFALMYGSVNIFLLGISPFLLRRTPVSSIGMLWKEYWFSSPELKEQAFGKLHVILAATSVFLNIAALFWVQLIYQGNVDSPLVHIDIPPYIGGYALVVLFLVFCLWIVWFTKPPRRPT